MINENVLKSKYKNPVQSKPDVFDESNTVFFNTCFDKNQLKNLIAWFLEKYGEKVTVDFLETLKQVGFHQATLAGVSLGVDDLQIPSQKPLLLSEALVKIGELTNAQKMGTITSVEKSQRLIDTWNQTSELLRQTAVQNFRFSNPVNPVFMMAFSGARGNISQVRQLVAMRGLMADPQGAILEFPIQSNFREGLTITEYLISCYGARKGLVDTALRTATSGYLTRRLVDAVQHVVVVMADCKTKKGILIKDKNVEHRLVGRVLLQDLVLNSTTTLEKNTLISHTLAKRIALKHTRVYVRSPLTCNTEKSVCQLCYGVNLAQGKLVSIGEAVGVIAGQSIGEPGTQLTMRTFHTGGVGVFSDQAMKSFTAPFDGKIEFLETLPGLFVRTPHGNIVYLVKYSDLPGKTPILHIKSVRGNQEIYQITQNQVPSGSLLWVKQGQYVTVGQLLLQASRIKTSKQQMPESSHPVQAPYSGEVFFESMIIRQIQKQIPLKGKKGLKKEDDVSPKFRTLTELGNFWVFSSSVQKESSLSNSFFIKGDVVSSTTPVFQYSITVPKKGQLKRANSTLVLVQKCFDFFISKIYYSKFFYCVIPSTGENQTTLLLSDNHPKKGVFTWYPDFKSSHFQKSGYYSILWGGDGHKSFNLSDGPLSEGSLQKHSSLEKTHFASERTRVFSPTQAQFFLAEHQVFQFRSSTLLEKQCCFFLTTFSASLSKKGLFQVEFPEKVLWSKKNLVSTKVFTYSSFLKKTPPFKTSLSGPGAKKTLFHKRTCTMQQIGISQFMKTALKTSQIFRKPQTNVIKKNQGWFYIPDKELKGAPHFILNKGVGPSQLASILLEPGKKFEKINFLKSSVSVNFLKTKNMKFLKSPLKRRLSFTFYSHDLLLHSGESFTTNHSLECLLADDHTGTKKLKVRGFPKAQSQDFCFYQSKLDVHTKVSSLVFQMKTKRQPETLLFFQKNSQHFFPDIQFLKQKWLLQNTSVFCHPLVHNGFQKGDSSYSGVRSPLFTKQVSTKFEQNTVPKVSLKMQTPFFSDWLSGHTVLKIQLTVNTKPSGSGTTGSKSHSDFQLYSSHSKRFFPGFSFLFFHGLKLQNSSKFCFKTFENGWVVPDSAVTDSFLTSKTLGEVRHIQISQNSTSLSVVKKADVSTLKFPHLETKKRVFKLGAIVRWGQELFPGFAAPVSGQILKLTTNTVTIRKGIPMVASARGVVHVFHNDVVKKDDLLITLKSRRLQTEDIVQGIPKIEQLFEARETQGGEILPNSPHAKLHMFFLEALQKKPFRLAVNQSLYKIQRFLVENILEAYSNQGVKISEKHVEIVVRQMTARVRILSGGDSGLLPGEIVQLKWVEKVNKKLVSLGSREARYEPLILGITKSVLQSESFLVAASFQEVSRVLVRSALTKKTDFLRGLHENVILGQLLPAGTGIISRTSFQDLPLSSLEKRDGT